MGLYLRWICCFQGGIVIKSGEMGTRGDKIMFCRRQKVGGSAKSLWAMSQPANQRGGVSTHPGLECHSHFTLEVAPLKIM
jgi:hypothetical protein